MNNVLPVFCYDSALLEISLFYAIKLMEYVFYVVLFCYEIL